jgi:hypothetical protein
MREKSKPGVEEVVYQILKEEREANKRERYRAGQE